MRAQLAFVVVALAVAAGVGACKKQSTQSVQQAGEQSIVLTDRTGKKWDVTHAVKKYGMSVENFHHGIGPYAFKPYVNPEMIRPGDAGYWGDDDTRPVIGVALNGDARAYPIEALIGHEVADDVVGGVPVAVAY